MEQPSVTMSEYTAAMRRPPGSEPAKSHALRPERNSPQRAFGGTVAKADATFTRPARYTVLAIANLAIRGPGFSVLKI